MSQKRPTFVWSTNSSMMWSVRKSRKTSNSSLVICCSATFGKKKKNLFVKFCNDDSNNKKIHWQVAREGIHPSMLAAYDKSYIIWKQYWQVGLIKLTKKGALMVSTPASHSRSSSTLEEWWCRCFRGAGSSLSSSSHWFYSIGREIGSVHILVIVQDALFVTSHTPISRLRW